MWPRSSIVVMAVVAMLMTPSQGHPEGAPAEVCHSMFPHHGVTPQTSVPPYAISLQATTYTPGSSATPIRVTLTSDRTAFKGLLVQARSLTNCSHTVGIFRLDTSEAHLQLLNCEREDDAVTHRDNNAKTTKTFLWVPPAVGMGHVYIRATVVQSKSAFWNTVQSPIIYQGSSDGSTSISCTAPSTMSEAKALDCSSHDDDDHDHDHDDDGGNHAMTVQCSHIIMTSLFLLVICLNRL